MSLRRQACGGDGLTVAFALAENWSREDGRTVPDSTLARGHYSAQSTFRALLAKFGANPAVTFRAIDNSGKPESRQIVGNAAETSRNGRGPCATF